MRNAFLFRPNGHVIRTRGRFDWWWVAVPLIIVLGAYAAVTIVDARAGLIPRPSDAVQLLEPEDAGVFDAGYARGYKVARANLLPQVRSAYERGLNDAARAIADKEPGIAMLQACRALAATTAGAAK